MSLLPASRDAGGPSANAAVRPDAAGRLAAGLETALCVLVLLFFPISALANRAEAALAIVAGICGAGLIVLRQARLRRLLPPTLLLGGLVLWGALSAFWSIHPGRSLDLAARLAALYLAALALTGAAETLAEPRRMLRWGVAGAVIGAALALFELWTGGAISAVAYQRPFTPTNMNHLAVVFAILMPPVLATVITLRRAGAGTTIGTAMAATVYALLATIAKLILPLAVLASAVLLLGRRTMTTVAAVVTALLILSAPMTFSRLADLPGVLARADEVKSSAWHRLEIWQFAGRRIAERPVLGWGLDASRAIPGGDELIRPGQTRLPLHPHNAALQLRLELGIPGAVLFALFAGWLWLRVARSTYPPLFAASLGGALLGATVAALGSYDIWHEWWVGTLSFIAFVIAVMGEVCRRGDGRVSASPSRIR